MPTLLIHTLCSTPPVVPRIGVENRAPVPVTLEDAEHRHEVTQGRHVVPESEVWGVCMINYLPHS